MEIVLVTGMLASGKSIALRSFQDLNYYCIDNLPPSLIKSFVQLAKESNPPIKKAALVVDVRVEGFLSDLDDAILYLRENSNFKMLFVDAADEVLISRYKLNRRRHLMFENERIEQTIAHERLMMNKFRIQADYVIDTSNSTEAQFKARFANIFATGDYVFSLQINIVSFGYKYGLPKDCDLVFDVRFMPNPYYIKMLKPLSGLDESVSKYVFSFDESKTFLKQLNEMLCYIIPYYKREGKSQLVIGIGCSGGRHRSVAVAEALKKLLNVSHAHITLEHRDIKNDKYIRGLD